MDSLFPPIYYQRQMAVLVDDAKDQETFFFRTRCFNVAKGSEELKHVLSCNC